MTMTLVRQIESQVFDEKPIHLMPIFLQSTRLLPYIFTLRR